MKGAIAGLLVYNERHMQRYFLFKNSSQLCECNDVNWHVAFCRLNRLRQNTAILPYPAAKIQATRSNDEAMDVE